MHWIHRNGLTCLQFPFLSAIPGVDHGVFLRHARDAEGQDSILNLGLNCGSPEQQTWENRRRVRSFFGNATMVFGRQVHGSGVAVWNEGERLANKPVSDHIYLEGDAIITDLTNHLLFIQVADCQAVMMVDPVSRVVANVHSGWRGSIQNIVGRTVEEMVRKFGCHADRIVCGIGPSLGPCCAEFIHYQSEIPKQYWSYGGEENRFDFWRITTDQLTNAGVPNKNITVSNICTRCNRHHFFSYRGDGNTGRFAAVIGLREE